METLVMSTEERRRAEIFSRVGRKELTLVKAGELLRISYRQAKRLWARYDARGDAALVHGLRGRKSNHQAVSGAKERALALYRERYSDYGPTLASECLARDDELIVPASTLRRWLTASGLWERQRKRQVHRRRRARREHRGELLQMDGSHHDWFEGRRGWAVLMVIVDDATGTVWAWLFENESWHSAAAIMLAYVQAHGLPRALYVDRHSIYRADWEPTPAEILAEKQPETQFGRAMRELGVELILAHSPQAKGRVERMNLTLQDRLVKALRRADISDLPSANAFLAETFLPAFNQQFAKPAAQPVDVHRVPGAEVDLARVLSVQEPRVVQNDWTVRWRNGFLQLASDSPVQPGASVMICEQLDGRLRVMAGERELPWTTTRRQAKPARQRPRRTKVGSSQGQKPAANHPWRRGLVAPDVDAARGSGCSASVATLPALHSQTP